MPTHLSALQQLLMPTDGFNGFQGSFCLETLSNGRCAVIDRAYSVDSATVGAVYDRHLEAQGKVRAGEKLERKGERNERRGEHLEKKGTRLENGARSSKTRAGIRARTSSAAA